MSVTNVPKHLPSPGVHFLHALPDFLWVKNRGLPLASVRSLFGFAFEVLLIAPPCAGLAHGGDRTDSVAFPSAIPSST